MNKNTAQALSFISGLTIATVVVGVTVANNQTIRSEIESQLKNVLSITKPLLSTLKGIVTSQNSSNTSANAEDTTQIPDKTNEELDQQWQSVGTSSAVK